MRRATRLRRHSPIIKRFFTYVDDAGVKHEVPLTYTDDAGVTHTVSKEYVDSDGVKHTPI